MLMNAGDLRTMTNQLFVYLISNQQRALQLAMDNGYNVQACLMKILNNNDYW
jgi:hypothetical protein